MAFEDELGAQPPLGFFDPLGMLDAADARAIRPSSLRRDQARTYLPCLPSLDTSSLPPESVFQETLTSLETTFASIPTGFAALTAIPAAGLAQIIAFIGALELGFMKDATGENEFVGDFRNGFIDFGWDSFDAETQAHQACYRAQPGPCRTNGYPCLDGSREAWSLSPS